MASPGYRSRPPADPWRVVLLVALVLAAVPLGLFVVTWGATNTGTVVAALLAALVYVPPFLLFWGWSGQGQSRPWRSDRHFQRDVRRLLDGEIPPTGG